MTRKMRAGPRSAPARLATGARPDSQWTSSCTLPRAFRPIVGVGMLMYITILRTQRIEPGVAVRKSAPFLTASSKSDYAAWRAVAPPTRAIRVILSGFGQLLAGVKISTRRNLRIGRFEERPSVISRATTVAGVGRGDIERMRSAGSAGEQSFRVGLTGIAGAALLVLLTACGEKNTFIAPPPPKVTVQFPLQQTVTPYLEATGNAASINNIKLVARVQGYVQEIKYQDGQAVKKGTPLFIIEPQPYKVALEQAQAAEEGAKATLVNAEAEFTRQQELQSKDVSTQANLDKARANRDTARANVLQAQANTQQAEINLGYTTVAAPFDGIVTARKVSVGELVGGSHTSELATIVQINPIWVWFNLSEQDVPNDR